MLELRHLEIYRFEKLRISDLLESTNSTCNNEQAGIELGLNQAETVSLELPN